MGNQDRLRVGHVGVGGFGGCRRARMRETGLFTIVAACDHNPQNLAQCQAGGQTLSSLLPRLLLPTRIVHGDR